MELSVVIPTRDRPQRLLETLQALAASEEDGGPTWEALVVDDGGAPEAMEPVARWVRASSAPVRLLRQDPLGPAAARNRGARESRGRVIVFLDDDMVVGPGFLSRHLRAVDGQPGCWIVGRITHPEALLATPFGRWRHARWEEFHRAHAAQGLQPTDGISAANLSLPAADFARLGGFDEGFALAGCEDRELGLRARGAGVRVLYDPENVALHQDWAVSLPRFCERQRLYALSDVRLWRLHGSNSPRAALVAANAPIARGDGPGCIARKAAKALLATPPGRLLLRGLVALAERMAPARAPARRAYDAAVAVAIFRGVREGLARHPGPPASMSGARVCHLIDFNRDTPYFRAIARDHDRERWPVAIGSLEAEGELQGAMRALDVSTFALRAAPGWGALRATLRLARLLRSDRVALLHAHCFHPTLTGLLAARLAGVPFVFTRHHSDHHLRLGKRWHTRVDAWCARRAAHVIAVSDATRRILVETERVPADRISVVWNGMESLAVPAAGDLRALREELGIPPAAAVCVVPARLHEEKGHAVLLRAAAEVARAVPGLLVLCAGDGPHRAALEREVGSRGLEGVVRFLGQRRDVPALIALSRLVVLPSLAESFGLAALEAMSLGRAVLASRAGGLPEVVSDGETGVLVDVGDAAGLARAMTALLRDPGRAAALGAAGRERARAFSSQRMVRGYEEVYGRIAR